MASCSGCGLVLGFKKYKFKKLWRIAGSYCKPCMMEIGKNWEDHGRVTLPMRACDLCQTEFYFLKTAWQGKKQKHWVTFCPHFHLAFHRMHARMKERNATICRLRGVGCLKANSLPPNSDIPQIYVYK